MVRGHQTTIKAMLNDGLGYTHYASFPGAHKVRVPDRVLLDDQDRCLESLAAVVEEVAVAYQVHQASQASVVAIVVQGATVAVESPACRLDQWDNCAEYDLVEEERAQEA